LLSINRVTSNVSFEISIPKITLVIKHHIILIINRILKDQPCQYRLIA
jgi:hypothetical protein